MSLQTSSQDSREGPPLLFVHGMWHGDWCWNQFVTSFRKAGFNAHPFNLTRHGKKYAGPNRLWWPLFLGRYIKDLKEKVSTFPRTPILVGHSLGCLLIEITMAQLRPPAVVLLAPTRADIFSRSVNRFRIAHPREFWRLLLTLTMWPPISTPELCREMFFSSDFSKEKLKELHPSHFQNESYFVAAQLLAAGILRFGLKPAPACGIPALVMGGGFDRAVDWKDVELVAAYHGTEAVPFPGMGHDLMLDDGHKAVAKHITAWLGGLDRTQILGGHLARD